MHYRGVVLLTWLLRRLEELWIPVTRHAGHMQFGLVDIFFFLRTFLAGWYMLRHTHSTLKWFSVEGFEVSRLRGTQTCSFHCEHLLIFSSGISKWIFVLPHVSYRITEWLTLEETSEGHLVQNSATAGSPRASCPGPCPAGFLITPCMETSQPLWVPCSSSHSHSKSFLMFRWSIICFTVCPLPLVLSLSTTGNSLAPSLYPRFIYLYTLIRFPPPPKPFLLSAFLIWEMFQSLNDLCGPSLDSVQYIHVSLVLSSPEMDTVL